MTATRYLRWDPNFLHLDELEFEPTREKQSELWRAKCAALEKLQRTTLPLKDYIELCDARSQAANWSRTLAEWTRIMQEELEREG